MKESRSTIELVAPVGGPKQLIAAINAGADSVYLGYKNYSARAFAENFNFDQLRWAVERAHSSDVKVYLTLNTIIKDEEIPDLIGFLNNYFDICTDGVIIQDMGLLKILRDLYPRVPVHTSTQVNIHNSLSLGFAAQCGFSRTVLAREMTVDEIKGLSRGNEVDLEIFGHGSQCYSFSGICYFSSFTGGRSGNRGRCAQPCRMKYQLVGVNGTKTRILTKKPSFFISKNDLFTLTILPQVIRSGIDALKIEGRMKTPEYVAIITKIYRKYIDLYYKYSGKFNIEREDVIKIKQIVSRELGTGYYEGHFKDIVDPDRSGSIGNFIGRIKKVGYGVKNREPSIDILCRQPIRSGDVLEIWTKKGNKRIEIKSLIASDYAGIKCQYKVEIDDEKVFSPKDRVFKYFDKKLDEEAKSLFRYDRVKISPSKKDIKGIHKKNRLKKYLEEYGIGTTAACDVGSRFGGINITLKIYSLEELKEALTTSSENIIISSQNELLDGKISQSGSYLKEIVSANKEKRIIIDTPYIIYDWEMDILKNQLENLFDINEIWLRISNIGVFECVKEIKKTKRSVGNKVILGDYLNISNTLSATFYDCLLNGAAGLEFSPELDRYEIKEIIHSFKRKDCENYIFSIFAHGFFKVITARHEILYPGKKRNSREDIYLTDKKDYMFRVVEDGRGKTGIYNSKKICTLFDLDKISGSRINNLVIDNIFTSLKDTAIVIKTYKHALELLQKKGPGIYKKYIKGLKDNPLFRDYSRGHLFRGVE